MSNITPTAEKTQQPRRREYLGQYDTLAKRAYHRYTIDPNDGPVLQYEQWYRTVWMPTQGGTADVPE
jgi:hypothetical protein